jgi:hypothetical protein
MGQQRWSVQQVAALAPDPQVAAAARRLSSLRTWSDLGCTTSLVWGRCQGSGKAPYQVTVDLEEPAFRCSCPSRKFPCKHGVALLLLYVEHGDAIGEVRDEASGFAGEWAAERAQRHERARARASRDAGGVADPDAQARRRAQREAAMEDGLGDLRRWLGDLVRQGLAAARHQPYGAWDAMAARLVDAQVPGLAERVRAAAGDALVRADWAEHLLAEAGRWDLAARAWPRRDELAPEVQADLRAYLGWGLRPEDRAHAERIGDDWVVAGVRQGADARLQSQRTWLWGRTTDRWAVVLDFAAAGGSLQVAQPVGAVVHDELLLHAGTEPRRAELSGRHVVVAGAVAAPRAGSVADALARVSAALAANVWRDRLAVALGPVEVVGTPGSWWLEDQRGDRLPLAPGAEPWALLAGSGGAPAMIVAEWEAGTVHPMTLVVDGGAVVSL